MLNNGFDEWMSSIDYLITSDSEKETTKYFLELAMQAGVCIKKTLNLTQSLWVSLINRSDYLKGYDGFKNFKI